MMSQCNVGKTFLDSGAHTLYTERVMKKGKRLAVGSENRLDQFEYYRTEEFWDYVDTYCEFLLKHKDELDYYVTVDVIFNPDMSWKVQKYMEDKYKLNPVPVIHWGTDEKWLVRYLKEGYDYLGIGGVGQEANWRVYPKWGDRVFGMLCENGKPKVKTHGFAMTSFALISRYPWHSVDSSSWAKMAGYGKVYVPTKRQGKFSFDFRLPALVTNHHRCGRIRNQNYYAETEVLNQRSSRNPQGRPIIRG